MARAYNQAQKFGAEIAIPDEAAAAWTRRGGWRASGLSLGNGESVRARSVVLASGARYRRLDIANLADFEGTCVHYWATPIETQLCAGQEVALAGAGNSAGQAVVYPGRQGEEALDAGARREPGRHHVAISGRPHPRSAQCRSAAAHRDLRRWKGEGGTLKQVRWRNRDTRRGDARSRSAIVFSFIGADPNTDWLAGCGIALDDKGFVLTGAERARHPLATNRDGIFAVGDVRCGSVKRVAAAVGEGSTVVSAHPCLSGARARRRCRKRRQSDGRRFLLPSGHHPARSRPAPRAARNA